MRHASLLLSLTAVGGCVLARPAPAVVGSLPADLPGRRLQIASPSGSALAAWLVDGRPGCGAILLLHGVGENRLAMLPRARFFHRAGYAVLLVDFQAHGESAGDHITFGARESRDAAASLATLRAAAPNERVGILGVSLGGAAMLEARPPLVADAAVLESVYPTIEHAVENRFTVWLGPLRDLAPLTARTTLALTAPHLGLELAALRPIDRIGESAVPLLIASGSEDSYTTPSETRALFARARPGTELWIVAGAGHEDLYAFGRERYEERVGDWMAQHLRTASCEQR